MGLSWLTFGLFFKDQPDLRVMAFFGCHHKTVAMGLPLIKAIYEDNPKLGLYCLPLLMWHPMQLFIGTSLTPKFKVWVAKENKKYEHLEMNEIKEKQKEKAQPAQQEGK